MPRLLFQRFPVLRRNLPWMMLADLPSRVHRIEKLGDTVGLSNVWIKRDDENSTLYGGNKSRKFEFLFGDARARGCTEVVTSGSDGSNHGAATSLFGRKLGFDVTMVCSPQPNLSYVRKNILIDAACGAKLIHRGSEPAMFLAILRYLAARRLSGHGRAYYMYFGGSSALGTVGFVEAALELAAQVERGEIPEPKYLFVPTGSCGTHAGLEVGLRVAGLSTKVIGVRIVAKAITNRFVVANLANRTARLLRRRDPSFPKGNGRASDVTVLDGFFGGQYGKPTPECKEAIRLLGETESIPLDPTYSGKGFAGMLGFCKENGIADEPVLFWLTLNTCDLDRHLEPAPPVAGLPLGLRQYFETELFDPDL